MRNQFRFILLAALAISAFAFPTAAQEDDVFRVAAVAPSATTDLAFSQSMFDALTLLDEELDDAFEFVFQEGTFIVDDAAVALREWAASGEYDLIIAHGSQYGSIIEELAPEFPDTSFAWGTDENTFGLDNVFAYTAASDQGGYINGFLAGTLSETGVIGVVGPIEVGDAKLYVDGFVIGAQAANPEAEVNVNYIQSFSDVPLATEAANAFVANGADILTGSAQMVVGPIAVAIENELLWFGTQASQEELSAASGMTFQVYRWDVVLKDIIAKIGEGTLGGESYVLTLENEGLEIVVSQALDEEIGETVTEIIDLLTEGIIAGDIVTLPEEDLEATAEGDAEATPEATAAP
jgi:basic membrane lipoprotein Med (substrate-binding protein (PBP1-ABC) superfamily)